MREPRNTADLTAMLEAQGLAPRPYSGRGMFGRYCVGVSLKHTGEADLPAGYSHDALGMGVIAYWPTMDWPQRENKEGRCRWFLNCTRPATGTSPHPILGNVATCDQCAKFARGE